jgi:predicted SprT family Zn-dependent metalloprotease
MSHQLDKMTSVDLSGNASPRAKNPMEDGEYVVQVRQRFQRDFLPRFGPLWRSMLQQANVKENDTVSNGNQSRKVIKMTSHGSMNFVDAIASQKPVTVRAASPLLPHQEICSCGCESPTMKEMKDDKDNYTDDVAIVNRNRTGNAKVRDGTARTEDEISGDEAIESTTTDDRNDHDDMEGDDIVFDLGELRKNLPDTSSPGEGSIVPNFGRRNNVVQSTRKIKIEGTDDESSKGSAISSEEEKHQFDFDSNPDVESSYQSIAIISDREVSSTQIENKKDGTKNQAHKGKNKNQKPRSTGTVFQRNRNELTRTTFDEFNRNAFGGVLESVEVIWNKKLNTTAGLTRLRRCKANITEGVPLKRLASIELSTKVVDSKERLRTTLLHELVHAVVWIVDGVDKPPHGPNFKKWARIAMSRIPNVIVTTTHSYEIDYKFIWKCSNPSCSVAVRRHSKSFDPTRYRCGKCKGNFVEAQGFRSSKHQSQPSPYNTFVKEQSKSVRKALLQAQRTSGAQNPSVAQGDVMKECARLWRERQSN